MRHASSAVPPIARARPRWRALVTVAIASGVAALAITAPGGAHSAAATDTTVIDPGFALTQVGIGGGPVDVAPGDGGTVWVGTIGGMKHMDSSGSGYSFATGMPNAITADDEGGVWGTIPGLDRVFHFDRSDNFQAWSIPTPNGSPVATYDSGGYVYVVEQNAKRMARINQVTGDITDYPIPGAVSPNAIDGIADADGSHHTVWVTDPGAGRVWVLGTDGALLGSVDALGSVDRIQLLASVGGLVEGIASTATSVVYFKQTAGATPVVELVGGRSGIRGITAFDGGVWVTDSGAKSLLFYKNSTLTQYHSPEMGDSLSGITVTDGRYVWMADQSTGKVDRLDLQAKRVVDRVGGADRYEVSAHVSAKAYRSGASTVFVASGEVFADALSVGPLAARAKAPVLLTSRDRLPGSVADELSRLKPEQVVIVGGTASVSKAVETAISARAPGAVLSRIDGPDRYFVSRALLNSAYAPNPTDRLFIANGGNFPDALSSGPAAAVFDSGVLLVNGAASALSSQELDLIRVLVTSGGTVEIVGGPNSVSPAIEAQIRGIRGVERIGGADRFEVSQALNARVFPRPARSYLASGTAFADALAGGAAAGAEGAPLYLSRPGCIPGSIARGAVGASVAYVTLLGGPATLTPDVENLTACP